MQIIQIIKKEKSEKYFFRQVYGLEGQARKKAPWIFKLVIFFVAETKTKEIKLSSEHVGFVWLEINEAIKKITFKFHDTAQYNVYTCNKFAESSSCQ